MSRQSSPRRAMTLIEVLAATLLLAILGSASVSLLRSIRTISTNASEPDDAINTLTLERMTDKLIEDGAFREQITTDSNADFTTNWPDEPAVPPVRIRRVEVEKSGEAPAHAWLAFTCGKITVWRCIQLPREKPLS